MNEADALDIVQFAIWTVLTAAGPAVAVAMIVGIGIALVQALTQIQEITLTFVPKIVAILLVVAFSGPYIGGQISSFYGSPASAAPYIESGKLRAIAVTGAKRSPFMPTVPTIAEAGYPGVVAENWYAFITSSKVPRPILERWNRELVKALGAPDVKEQLAKHFLEPHPSTRAELAAYIKRDYDTWGRVIKAAGITGE